jgi:hypothetical protein
MCDAPRLGAILPSMSSTLDPCSAVVFNKNCPAAAATLVPGPGHPLKGTLQSLKHLPSPACKSPTRDAKEKVISCMKPKPRPSAMRVSDVVQLPFSSLDSKLEVPVATDIVAHAGTGFIDLAGNESNGEVISTPLCPRQLFGGKTTGLEDTQEKESLLFSPNTSASPTDNEVSKYLFFSCLAHYLEGNRISGANCTAVELCIFV